MRWILCAVAVALSLASCDDADESREEPKPRAETWRDEDNWAMAYVMTKDWVSQRLKAPRTAKFPGSFSGEMHDHTTYLGDQKYRIESWVDSQNAFGAMIRTRFTAEVQQVDEDRWQLLSLEFAQ